MPILRVCSGYEVYWEHLCNAHCYSSAAARLITHVAAHAAAVRLAVVYKPTPSPACARQPDACGLLPQKALMENEKVEGLPCKGREVRVFEHQ